MNILQHIEAGHYPKDERGRALVPCFEGATATIIATDKPGIRPIIGWVPTQAVVGSMEFAWSKDGRTFDTRGCDLLPPPPRKVKVTRYVIEGAPLSVRAAAERLDRWPELPRASYESAHSWRRREDAENWVSDIRGACVVELTGEYEEPWS